MFQRRKSHIGRLIKSWPSKPVKRSPNTVRVVICLSYILYLSVPPSCSPNTDTNTVKNTNTGTCTALSKYWSRSELCASAGTVNRGFSAKTSSPVSKSSESERATLIKMWIFQTREDASKSSESETEIATKITFMDFSNQGEETCLQRGKILDPPAPPLSKPGPFWVHFSGSLFSLFFSVNLCVFSHFFVCYFFPYKKCSDLHVDTSLHIIFCICHFSSIHLPCDRSGKKGFDCVDLTWSCWTCEEWTSANRTHQRLSWFSHFNNFTCSITFYY